MKRIRKVIFPLLFSLVLVLSTGITAFAAGDGNIDGGGGGMGSGTATDVWHGQDGVRITVVTSGGSAVSTPFDLSNSNIANNVINFGKVSKLSYTSGTSLSPNGYYSCSKPGVALPASSVAPVHGQALKPSDGISAPSMRRSLFPTRRVLPLTT